MVKNSTSLNIGYEKIKDADLEKEGLCVIRLRIAELDSTLIYYESKAETLGTLRRCLESIFISSKNLGFEL